MTSVSWSSTRSTGLSAFIALWKTIAISRQRNLQQPGVVGCEDIEPVGMPGAQAAAVVGDVAARDDRRWPQQPHGAVGERRLAAAALTGEADDLAGMQRQVDVAHGADVAAFGAVDDAETADVQHRSSGTGAGRGRPELTVLLAVLTARPRRSRA